MTVNCPACGKSTEYAPENPFRPFCSERCRLIDLGQWAEGKYAIPAEPIQTHDIDESSSDDDSDRH